MTEVVRLIIGIGVLFLGIPLGNLIARWTKEELHSGQKYFRILIWIGLIGGVLGLFLDNDILLFSMFFIAIVASGSVEHKQVKAKKKK